MVLTVAEWALVFGIVFAASLMQAVIGFGVSIVAVPFVYLVEPGLVPGPMLAVGLAISLLNLVGNRAGLALGELGRPLVGLVPGIAVGVSVLAWAPRAGISLLLGAAVLVAVYASVTQRNFLPGPRGLFFSGVASGFMSTTVSMGGLPMALIYQHVSGDRLRANLSGFFVVVTTASIVVLALVGRFHADELQASLVLIPAVITAYALARVTKSWWDSARIRPILLAVCLAAAVGVLVDGMRTLAG